MSQNIPIYIPTYINSADYAPARVLPRLFFFNGTLDCETYYIQDENGSSRAQDAFSILNLGCGRQGSHSGPVTQGTSCS